MSAALRVSAPQVQQQVINKGQLKDSDFGLTPARAINPYQRDSLSFPVSVSRSLYVCPPPACYNSSRLKFI
jgi:hypothetical protein